VDKCCKIIYLSIGAKKGSNFMGQKKEIRQNKIRSLISSFLALIFSSGVILILIVILFQLDNSNTQQEKIINVKNLGAVGDNMHDDTQAIQNALNVAKNSNTPIQVIIPTGTYKLTKTLHIYKNTHLLLKKDAKLIRNHNGIIIMNGDKGDHYEGYDGHGDIIIEGGIWEGNILNYPSTFSAIGIARGRNITIRNIEVRDVVNAHGIDLNASENVLIENSKFLGFSDRTYNKSRFYSEAIQISEHTKPGFSEMGVYDGTPNKNVTIRNCYFGPSGTKGTTAWPVGVGNHLSVYNKFNTNIKIYNNTFEGMKFAGIQNFKWKDTEIMNNTFLNCERGIVLQNPNGNGESSKDSKNIQTNLPQSGLNISISKNKFKNTYKENIYIVGRYKDHTISKVNSIIITDNLFENQLGINNNPNIYLTLVNEVEVSKNTISKVHRGIHINSGSNINIIDNKFEELKTDALIVNQSNVKLKEKGNASNINITRNTILQFRQKGLFLKNTNGFKINQNVFIISNQSKQDAIKVDSSSKNGLILENRIVTSKIK
jgi:parallel beta-helix repeat protein